MHNNNEKMSDEAPNPSYTNIWLISAPIFFNTAQDSGALPIEADVSHMKTGDVLKYILMKAL